jgi:flagellar hook-length control protein FliK
VVTVPIEPPISGHSFPSALPAPVTADADFSRLLEETLIEPAVAASVPVADVVVSEDALPTHAAVDGNAHHTGRAEARPREGQPISDAARPVTGPEKNPPDEEVDAPAPNPPIADQGPGELAAHALHPALLPAPIPQPAPERAAPATSDAVASSPDRLVARAPDAMRSHHPWESPDSRSTPVAGEEKAAPAHETRASAGTEALENTPSREAPAPAQTTPVETGGNSRAVPETASVHVASQPTDSAREATPERPGTLAPAQESPTSIRPADPSPARESMEPSRIGEALVAPAAPEPSGHPAATSTVTSPGASNKPAEPHLALINRVIPPEDLILDPDAVPAASATSADSPDRPAGPDPVETAWEPRRAILQGIRAASRNRPAEGAETILPAGPTQREVPLTGRAPDGTADSALRFVESTEHARIPAGEETAQAAADPRGRELTLLRGTVPVQNLLHPLPEDAYSAEAARENDPTADVLAAERGEPADARDTVSLRPQQGVLDPTPLTSTSPSGAGSERAATPTLREGLTLDGPAEQIVTAAHLRLRGDGGTVDVRLDPPELGQIRLQVTLQDGVLVARLSAETAAACQLLEGQAGVLRSALLDCGLPVQSLEISMGLGHSDGHPAQANQEETPGWGRQTPGESLPPSPAPSTPRHPSPRIAGIDYLA